MSLKYSVMYQILGFRNDLEYMASKKVGLSLGKLQKSEEIRTSQRPSGNFEKKNLYCQIGRSDNPSCHGHCDYIKF